MAVFLKRADSLLPFPTPDQQHCVMRLALPRQPRAESKAHEQGFDKHKDLGRGGGVWGRGRRNTAPRRFPLPSQYSLLSPIMLLLQELRVLVGHLRRRQPGGCIGGDAARRKEKAADVGLQMELRLAQAIGHQMAGCSSMLLRGGCVWIGRSLIVVVFLAHANSR